MNVYAVDVRRMAPHVRPAMELLATERKEKALLPRKEEDRLRSLCGSLLIRRFLGAEPMAYGPWGKPFLADGPGFSLSHSGDYAVLAVNGETVGVDVEKPRTFRPELPRRVFLPEEREWMEGSPEERFIWLWTRKEAVMKACGKGLSLSPDSFRVLPGDVPVVDGLAYALHSEIYDRHFISAAAERGAFFTVSAVEAEELLY